MTAGQTAPEQGRQGSVARRSSGQARIVDRAGRDRTRQGRAELIRAGQASLDAPRPASKTKTTKAR